MERRTSDFEGTCPWPIDPKSRRSLVSVALICLTWLVLAVDRHAIAGDRPAGPPHKTRSSVMARHGMAATSQPLATAAAIRVLQKGGNAIDAAIAANAVLGVVEPMSCGIGGDLFAIVWDAKSKRLYGLNASGRAPAAATIELFKAKGLKDNPDVRAPELVGSGLCRRMGPASQAIWHQGVARAARSRNRICGDRFSGERDHRGRLAQRRGTA